MLKAYVSDAKGIDDIAYYLNCNLLWKDHPDCFNKDSIWSDIMKNLFDIHFECASVIREKGRILDIKIWYNSSIRINNKSIFWKKWYDIGIKIIFDLVLPQLHRYLTWQEICSKYNMSGNHLH